MTNATYTVTGMTCEHCAHAVTEEIGLLAGVYDVDVDLATGRVTVTSDRPLEQAELVGAIDEAGGDYRLAGTGAS
jgi:copper chaperone CopZ